jgi:hypothetical protein
VDGTPDAYLAADRDEGVDALGTPIFVGCKTADRAIRSA